MHQPLAYIHSEAKIAQNVVVEPFVTIHSNVEIDEGCWIGPHVTIMEGARIGKNVKIFPGSVVSAIPQDLKYQGEESLVIIKDGAVIREYATINRGTSDKYKTIIGENSLLMAYTHIAHDSLIGENCIIANSVNIAGHVTISDYAVVGGLTAIQQFVKIGEHVMVSGGSLVRKDVPPYTKAAREPLSYVGINSIGMRRRGMDSEKIKEIQEIYRHIYLKGNNISQALEIVEKELPATRERDDIISFIQASEQGIMRGYRP